jgi:hypothetical protein
LLSSLELISLVSPLRLTESPHNDLYLNGVRRDLDRVWHSRIVQVAVRTDFVVVKASSRRQMVRSASRSGKGIRNEGAGMVPVERQR